LNDSRIKIAIAISLAVHLALLGFIGRTSAARPIDVEQLKVVKVDLVRTPDHVSLAKPDQPKPIFKDAPKPPPLAYVPPVQKMRTDTHPPKPLPRPLPAPQRSTTRRVSAAPNGPVRIASSRVPGDPGGGLNMGTPSPNGEDLGNPGSGRTPVGWVPSPSGGAGVGSGTGPGVARPDPDPNASPGPGTSPAPSPPPPTAQPKMIEVTVCEISGERPNPDCQKKVTRTFVEGREPRGVCDRCKPEPKHQSRTAEVREAERIKDAPVDLPDSVRESGIDTRVTVTYTVGTDGSVSDVSVVQSSGNAAVDRAVVAAASRMKYRPAMQDGVPRSVKMRRTYRIRC